MSELRYWTDGSIAVMEAELDGDLTMFHVMKDGEYYGSIVPASIDDRDECVKALDTNGASDVTVWDDGLGNAVILEKGSDFWNENHDPEYYIEESITAYRTEEDARLRKNGKECDIPHDACLGTYYTLENARATLDDIEIKIEYKPGKASYKYERTDFNLYRYSDDEHIAGTEERRS